MAIENRNLSPGTKLVVTYKKQEYRAEVVAGVNDKVRYQLADGREFKSPSSAGTAITGKACNGWAFWSVDEAYVRADKDEDGEAHEAEAEEPTSSPSKGFRRVPNQRGVADGEVRLYCDACGKSFTTKSDDQRGTCPKGHSPENAQVSATTE